MHVISTILTAAVFSAHILLGCGCLHPHAHDAEADHESGPHACGDHRDTDDSQQPCEPSPCRCGHVGCVYVVGPNVKSTLDLGARIALVEIASRAAANLPGPEFGRAALEVRSGPPPSQRLHLLLQILLV